MKEVRNDKTGRRTGSGNKQQVCGDDERIAERLDKWSGEAMDVFWPKEKEDGDAQIV